MKVKICGINDQQFLKSSGTLSFDLAGLIFYPKSPRYVINVIKPSMLNNLASNIKRVGVFVDEDKETIKELIDRYSLDVVQLHGDEDPAMAAYLSGYADVIKAFRVSEDFDFEQTKKYEDSCRYFLFDTKGEKYGGTGQQYNWEILSSYSGKLPFFLSGGIGPEDVKKIQQFNHPQCIGIDINSRFETSPGIKDLDSIETFLRQLK